MTEHCVRYVALPFTMHGITVEDSSGFYNIYINSQLAEAEQRKALIHELQHVLRGDFDSGKTLSEVEPYRAPAEQAPIRYVSSTAVPPVAEMGRDTVPGKRTPEAAGRTEITTIGQLLGFMVELDAQRRKTDPRSRRRTARVNIDIWADDT